jgi:hypothetical protein
VDRSDCLHYGQNIHCMLFASIDRPSTPLALDFVWSYEYVSIPRGSSCADTHVCSRPCTVHHWLGTLSDTTMPSCERSLGFFVAGTIRVRTQCRQNNKTDLTKAVRRSATPLKPIATRVFLTPVSLPPNLCSVFPPLNLWSVFNALSDLILALLPVPMIWKLRTTVRTRVSLCLVLGLGLLYVSRYVLQDDR